MVYLKNIIIDDAYCRSKLASQTPNVAKAHDRVIGADAPPLPFGVLAEDRLNLLKILGGLIVGGRGQAEKDYCNIMQAKTTRIC